MLSHTSRFDAMGWAGSRREIIVPVQDGFSKLGSMVAGDAG